MLSYWARKLALGSIEVQTNIGVSKHHHTGHVVSVRLWFTPYVATSGVRDMLTS